MYPPRQPKKEVTTRITASTFLTTHKPPTCTCGERLHLITVQVVGPIDERTITRRYPGLEACPKCRLADLSRVSRWDWDRVREFLKNDWVPNTKPSTDRIDMREI